MMTHASELGYIHYIQEFRTPATDAFFKALNYFDRGEFFLVLIPAIWFGVGWKSGVRIFYILLLSVVANGLLKEFFASPRPFDIDPSVGIIHVGGFGFPSGAAQTVILLSGILLCSWQSRWRWPVAGVYIALISFSRVYLGVHFPTDILGGWVVGLALWAIYTWLRPPLEKKLNVLQPFHLFLLSLLVPLLLLSLSYSVHMLAFCNIAMGLGTGLFAVEHFWAYLTSPLLIRNSALRAVIGVLSTIVWYTVTLLLPTSISLSYQCICFFSMGVWIAVGSYFSTSRGLAYDVAIDAMVVD